MVLRIRLSRPIPASRRHLPRYNIVLTQAKTARDSKPMEVLGTYNPMPQAPLASSAADAATRGKNYKEIELDLARTKYWLGVGAQPTESMHRILSMMGLILPKPNSASASTSKTASAQSAS